MSFAPQQALSNYVGGISLYGRSSPALVILQDKIHIYFSGSGSDGIWHTTYNGSATAIHSISRDLRSAPNTSPAAVSYNNRIYVFHLVGDQASSWAISHSVSTDGSYFYLANGSLGFAIINQDFAVATSPSATVFDGKIHVFWSGRVFEGFYTVTFDNKAWSSDSRVPGPSVRKGSSPHSIVFNDKLYLFWNSSGADGICYCTFQNGSWSSQTSVKAQVTDMAVSGATTPSALVMADGSVLRLFWMGSNGGAYYSDLNRSSNKWNKQTAMGPEIGGQAIYSGSNPCAIEYRLKPYVFWSGLERQLWFSTGYVADISTTDWVQPVQWLKEKKCFTITIGNKPELNADLRSGLNAGVYHTSIPATSSAETTTGLLKKIIGNYPTRSKELSTLVTLTSAIIIGALNNGCAVEISVDAYVLIGFIPPN